MQAKGILAAALAFVTALAPLGVAGSFSTQDLTPPAPADHGGLPGLGALDGWVDVHGDVMSGPLTMNAPLQMGNSVVQFSNGALDGSNAMSGLRFAGMQVCLAGSAVPGCTGAGDITGVNPGFGLLGGGPSGDVTLSVDTAVIQQRVAGACAAGSSIRQIDAAGGVVCETDDNSGGTVTSVGTGAGLTGGPITTSGTLSIGTAAVTGVMLAPSSVASSHIQDGTLQTVDLAADAVTTSKIQDGTILEADLAFTPGDITDVTAGTGLAGGGASGSVMLSLAAASSGSIGGVEAGSCEVGAVVTGIEAGTGQTVCTVEHAWSWLSVPRNNTVVTADSLGATGLYNSATIGSDGLPVVAFRSGGLKVLHCGTVRCDAGNTVSTVDGAVAAAYASIFIGTDGFPVIAYQDNTNQDLKIAKCGNRLCNAGNQLTTVDSAGTVGQYTSIAVGLDGNPVVSYYHVTNADLRVLKCGNAACTAGNTITTVDSVGAVGLHTSLAMRFDGTPVIAYYDQDAGDLKVVGCGTPACDAGNVVTVVDGGGDKGRFSAIVQRPDGNPFIATHSAGDGTLRIVSCGNRNCNFGNDLLTVGFGLNNIGQYTSVTVGPDDRPTVTTYDATNGDLLMFKCLATTCTTGTIRTALDTGGNVGQYTSVTIGVDGNPLVAYQDVTNGDLKVAHVANPFGPSQWARR